MERKRSARLKIWEVRAGLRCSIIGTCLTLGELRKIAKKSGLAEDPRRLTDYDLHGTVVSKMDADNFVSSTVQKHLDAKFEGAIRKAKALKSKDEFFTFWEAAVDAGLIPGAYWALTTHPELSEDVEVRIYGEIHMMSHICGASNRGDAHTIAEVERTKAELAQRLSARIAERDRQLHGQRVEIERLSKRVRELDSVAAQRDHLRQLLDQDQSAIRVAESECELARLREESEALRRSRRELELRNEQLRARLRESERRITHLIRRNIIEQPVGDRSCPVEADESDARKLCGRCLLYVGGRPQTVCKLKEWVASRNGELLHHDGGIEHSAGMLGDLVRQADIVLFPVDCVSHGAAGTVKKLCESYGKRLCPLRTASVTAFRRAISCLESASQPPNRLLEA